MADRRMFSKTVADSDVFLDMPLSTQALYFHLGLRADDDGFVNAPKKIQKMVSATEDDTRLLIAKGFIIPFDSGVVVIKHWRIHNKIKSDRYKPTAYQDEKRLLSEAPNKTYVLSSPAGPVSQVSGSNSEPTWNQNGSVPDTQVRLTSLTSLTSVGEGGKPSKSKTKVFSPPTLEEVGNFVEQERLTMNPEAFFDFYEANGWTVKNGNAMQNWKSAAKMWARREKQNPSFKEPSKPKIKFGNDPEPQTPRVKFLD